MKRLLSTLAAVGGLLALAPAALADSGAAGLLRVEDKAGVFTREGVRTAEKKFADVTFKTATHFTVVTMADKDAPANIKGELHAAMDKKDGPGTTRVMREWAKQLAKSEHEKGVFTLAYLQGDRFWVVTIDDNQTDVSRHFTDADATKLSDLFVDGFRKAKGKTDDQAKATRDVALLAAADDVIAQLKNTTVPGSTGGHTDRVNTSDGHRSSGGGMSILGWVCILAVVGLGIWMVVAVIRAIAGAGRGYGGGGYGGGGYGGGYGGGGYGGGGGGGFFPSLLGGMFGAAAGSYLYDSFTGGRHSYDSGGGGYGGSSSSNDNGSNDTGAGDFDNGASGGGGDFGGGADDVGGGDFGNSGGGDFGGDSGGGDFGGGGGDFGGGGGDSGGGDW